MEKGKSYNFENLPYYVKLNVIRKKLQFKESLDSLKNTTVTYLGYCGDSMLHYWNIDKGTCFVTRTL